MEGMSKERFREKILSERLSSRNGSLVKSNPEDYGIGEYGDEPSVPEKQSQLMEVSRQILERKNIKTDHSVADKVIEKIKSGELDNENVLHLIDRLIKMRPQKKESTVEHTGNFAHWVLQIHKEDEKFKTINADI